MRTGEIPGAFSSKELDPVITMMTKLPPSSAHSYSTGINTRHKLYGWFNKKLFGRVREYFPGINIGLALAKYNNESVPIVVHSDYYVHNVGKPFKTILIPVGVNGNSQELESIDVHTIIFNETDRCTWSHDFWSDLEWNKIKAIKENNAKQYQEDYLGHLKEEDLECLTVKDIFTWRYGSLIHWDDEYLHASDNFTRNGINSKQAIVMHTYVL